MVARGRKSAALLSVATVNGIADVSRLPEPPKSLTVAQNELWRVVISSRGGDLISPEAYPVLVEYCRAVTSSNHIASLLDDFEPAWATDEEGLRRWDKLLAMQDRLAKNIASLGAKLRLTPSSRVQAISAGRNADKGEKRKPWEDV